ncbi:MAG: hypothetical protein IT362_04165 [Deltaproteobacteria bacterium]|nr:hypothetical protein [Deltaproteobacteria bacterium]
MADWAKIKFYWKSILGAQGCALTASSTFERTSIANIHSMLETNLWQADTSQGPHHITFDSGAGSARGADYLAVAGHNFNSSGASVKLQYSTDAVFYEDAFTAFTPASDRAFVKEFTCPGEFRYWRVILENTAAEPFIYICGLGTRTELDYASASFDPNEQEVKGAVNLSHGGYLAGAHSRHIERSMTIRFDDADEALYAKVAEWWEGNRGANFFVAWESANHPEEVFLMRPEARFSNPLKAGGGARDIVLSLAGRKE